MRLHSTVATSGPGEPDNATTSNGIEYLLGTLRGDLRQQMHLVIGLLEATAQEPLSPVQLSNVFQCRAIADHLLRLGDDVMELASPKPLTSSPAPFSSLNAIGEVISLMRVLAGNKGLELTLSMDSTVPDELMSDKDLIQGILYRVLDNSIRFTNRGSIVVLVTSQVMWADSPVLIIEVSDEGPGMPAEILAANWSPTGVPPDENGIGLSIIQKRLSAAGGHFSIVDSTCEGTTVRISIPLCPMELSAPDCQAGMGSPFRLLVVESSDISFALFETHVHGCGNALSRALNGLLGIEMVKSNAYDLVIMDDRPSGVDGYTATRIIREWETETGGPRVPILLISDEHVSSRMRRGASVGCSGYLNKPAQKDDIIKALNYWKRHGPRCSHQRA